MIYIHCVHLFIVIHIFIAIFMFTGSLLAKKTSIAGLIKKSPPLNGQTVVTFNTCTHQGRQAGSGDSPQDGTGSSPEGTPPGTVTENPDSTGDVGEGYVGDGSPGSGGCGDSQELCGDLGSEDSSGGGMDIGIGDFSSLDTIAKNDSKSRGNTQEDDKERVDEPMETDGVQGEDDDDVLDLNEDFNKSHYENLSSENEHSSCGPVSMNELGDVEHQQDSPIHEEQPRTEPVKEPISAPHPSAGSGAATKENGQKGQANSGNPADSTVRGGLYDGEEICIGGFPLNTFSTPKIIINIGNKLTEDTRKVVIDSKSGGTEMYDPSMPSDDLSDSHQLDADGDSRLEESQSEGVLELPTTHGKKGYREHPHGSSSYAHDSDMLKDADDLEGSLGEEDEGNALIDQDMDVEVEEGLNIVPEQQRLKKLKAAQRMSETENDDKSKPDKGRMRKERSHRRSGHGSGSDSDNAPRSGRRHSYSPDSRKRSHRRDRSGGRRSRERSRRRSKSKDSLEDSFHSVEKGNDRRSVHERKARKSHSAERRDNSNDIQYGDGLTLVVSRENVEDSVVVIIDDTSEEEADGQMDGKPSNEQDEYGTESRSSHDRNSRRDRKDKSERHSRRGDSRERDRRGNEYRDDFRHGRSRDRGRESRETRDRDRGDRGRDRDRYRDEREYDRHYQGRSREQAKQEAPQPIGLAKVFSQSINDIKQTDKNTGSSRSYKRKHNNYQEPQEKYVEMDGKRSREDEHQLAWGTAEDKDSASIHSYDSGSSKSRESSRSSKKKGKKKGRTKEDPEWVKNHDLKNESKLAGTYLGHRMGLPNPQAQSAQGSDPNKGVSKKGSAEMGNVRLSNTQLNVIQAGFHAFKVPALPRASKQIKDIFNQEPPPIQEKPPVVHPSPLLPLPPEASPRFMHVTDSGPGANFVLPQGAVNLPVMGMLPRAVNPSMLLTPINQRFPRVYQQVRPLMPLLQRVPMDNGIPVRTIAPNPPLAVPRAFPADPTKNLQAQKAQVKELLDLVNKQRILSKHPSAVDKDTTQIDMEVESPGSDYGPCSLTPPSLDDSQQPSSSDDNTHKPSTPLGEKILKLMKAVSDKKTPLQQEVDSSPTSAVELDKRQKVGQTCVSVLYIFS